MIVSLFHGASAAFGFAILFYQSQFKLRILTEYSGWFLLTSTVMHFYSLYDKISNIFAYSIASTGLLLVLPVGIALIQIYNGRHLLLDSIGLHIIFPVLNLFCIRPNEPIRLWDAYRFIVLYSAAYITYTEINGAPFPYSVLENLNLATRTILYIGTIFVQCFGVFLLKYTIIRLPLH